MGDGAVNTRWVAEMIVRLMKGIADSENDAVSDVTSSDDEETSISLGLLLVK